MDIKISLNPGSSVAQVVLEPGEQLTAEAGAMVAMSSDMEFQTTTYKKDKKGIGKALKRMISGESFFMNHYTAGSQGGDVWLSTTLPGDMKVIDLRDQKIFVQGGSYVASDKDVEVDFKWGGMKGMFSGEGLFWLDLNGSGEVIICAYGAIYEVEVDGDYIVDTSHIVAYSEGLDYKISKAGASWLSSFFGGEGLVAKFSGRGKIWCQSHSASSFGRTLTPFLKPKER